jgi:putative methionine-R-sulfoxide reductase with GAF domain/HAMP domain-containing protein
MLRKTSLQVQLIVFIVLALVLMAAGLMFVQFRQERDTLVDAERQRSLLLIENVHSTIRAVSPLITTLEDISELDERLAGMVESNADIEFITVTWPDGAVLFHSDPAHQGERVSALRNFSTTATEQMSVSGYGSVYVTGEVFDNPTSDGPEQYVVAVGVDADAISGALTEQIATILATALAAIVVVGVVVSFMLRSRVVAPINALGQAATEFSAGNLDYRIKPHGSRELIRLADTMNTMAGQLDQSRTEIERANRTLEDRIRARTRDLEVAARLSEQVATILDPDELLPIVVEMTKENFSLYHAHIYLLEEDHLTLAAGAGEAGRAMKDRGHRIPLGAQSIVARAARDNRPYVVDDVTEVEDFLPNPLLPATRSEAAFPLAVQNRVLGVLDVQSQVTARFDADLQIVFSTLGGQIAVTLDNARLFSEVDRSSRHQQVLGAITQEIQQAVSLEDVLQVAARELGRALRVPHTAIELQLQPVSAEEGETDRGAGADPAPELESIHS